MIVRAARGLGKIDTFGSPRGVTLVSTAEIEAMACLLAIFGLTPIRPGEDAPADARTLLTQNGATT
jgi:hypothetical protein